MNKFQYTRSCKLFCWGCSFDSILELKYAFSIQQEYEFLRSAVSAYYDPATGCCTDTIRGNTRRYTPDFLIRHRVTGKAYWIEIKPGAYEDGQDLLLRKKVAENFIQRNGYDWEYKVVYGNQVRLSLDQLVQFNECCRYLLSKKRGNSQQPYGYRLPGFITGARAENRVRFVMFGTKSSLKKNA